MAVHRLSLDDARRIAVHAQLLDEPRPTDVVETVERLTMLQIDPTAAIAPSADLVLWSRLGTGYRPEHLTEAVEHHRTLHETVAYIRPARDVPTVIAEWVGREFHPAIVEWLEANEQFRRDILARLAVEGPLLSRDIPDTSAVPWPSSGWTNNRNVTKMLESMARRGQIAVSGRKGRQRYWDLPEKVYGDGFELPSHGEATRLRDERRLESLGIARATGPEMPGEQAYTGEAGEPAEVEGVPGTWRVHPAYLDVPGTFRGRAALLSPFDQLIHNRVRAEQLWGYEYILEMYKPKEKRRWGYFALPILHHDRLVGKLDAQADRKAGRLVVNAVHEDIPFTRRVRRDVDREIASLATWLGLELIIL
ncbi:MAG: DNA glycosylase AlkZ-like family protein [Terrabacter sp.]